MILPLALVSMGSSVMEGGLSGSGVAGGSEVVSSLPVAQLTNVILPILGSSTSSFFPSLLLLCSLLLLFTGSSGWFSFTSPSLEQVGVGSTSSSLIL